MLESSSFNQPRYCFKFYINNSIIGLMKRGVQECISFFQPEDTTEKANHKHSDCNSTGLGNTRSTAKVVLWLAISVGVGLAVGQL